MANDIVLGYPNITPPVVTHLSTLAAVNSTTNTAESGSDEHSKLTIGVLATLYTLIFIIGIIGWLLYLFSLFYVWTIFFPYWIWYFKRVILWKFHHEYNVSRNIFIGTNKHNSNHDLKRLFIQSIVFSFFFFRFRVKNEFYKSYPNNRIIGSYLFIILFLNKNFKERRFINFCWKFV